VPVLPCFCLLISSSIFSHTFEPKHLTIKRNRPRSRNHIASNGDGHEARIGIVQKGYVKVKDEPPQPKDETGLVTLIIKRPTVTVMKAVSATLNDAVKEKDEQRSRKTKRAS